MYSAIRTIYKGEEIPLYYETNAKINTDDLTLQKYNEDDGEWIVLNVTFNNVIDTIYKFNIKFDELGIVLLRVIYKESVLSKILLEVKDNILQKLYEYEVGNWQIKDNQMLFYDLDGNIVAKYNLYDKYNKPTEDSVYLREKV